MRRLLFLSLLIMTSSFGQNKELLYEFDGVPQNLMLNPGSEVNFKFHVGIPLISHISLQAGFTGFSTYDIFADDGRDIEDKLDEAFDAYGKTEFIAINEQVEIINVGYRLPRDRYLSFGFYQEFDFLAKIPKDMVDLYYNGNTLIDKAYSIKKMGLRAELLGVLHVGLSKKLNSQWNIGARAKIYSSVFNAVSTGNRGEFITTPGSPNTYTQHLNNLNIKLRTSGLIFDELEEDYSSYVKENLLLKGSLGLGFDVGFTYIPEEQWEFTGSLLDIGFVSNSKDIRSYEIVGDYELNGLELNFDRGQPSDYWVELNEEFNEQITLNEPNKNYIYFRPVKLYGSMKYSFGEQRLNDCNFINNSANYMNGVGLQIYANASGVHTYLAPTLFYERKFGSFLQAKITYTVDSYSYKNVGFGIATQIGAFNMYLLADNLLHLNNVYEAKNASIQFGMNLVFKRR